MNYKTAAATFVPPVDQTPKKVWTENTLKDLYNRFKSLPDPDSEWTAQDEFFNEEVMDDLEGLVESLGKRAAVKAMKGCGATKEEIAQMF